MYVMPMDVILTNDSIVKYDAQQQSPKHDMALTPDPLTRDVAVSPAPETTAQPSEFDRFQHELDQEHTDLQAKVEQLAQILAREKRRSTQQQVSVLYC